MSADAGGTSRPGSAAADLDGELWSPEERMPETGGPERLLLARGQITPEQLETALERQREDPRLSVLEALVKTGAIDELRSLQTAAEHFSLPFRRAQADDVDRDVFDLLPLEYLRARTVLPIARAGKTVTIAVPNPEDIFLVDDLRRRLNMAVDLVVTPPEDIRKAIADLSSGPWQDFDEIVPDFHEDAVEVVSEQVEAVEDLERIAGESPVIRYVNYLIANAVRSGASDIHIELGEKRLRVRYRMDGILFEQRAPAVQMHAAIVSRLKIMAKLDIAERRLPQDGRIRVLVQGRSIDLRVSTLPMIHGEKCAMRILDKRAISGGLENLGMATDTLEAFRNEITQPHGIVLVAGPTGSGKSTTLYAAIRILDNDKLNISTVEDPVEYELESINQVSVQESIGRTFAAALRSLLRQDPDVIMVGEIRDDETARITVQASLTGHMVFSTLHTNDAASSVTRLMNIGIEPYLISASMRAVLAQRLVRRICQDCKRQETDGSPRLQEYLKRYGLESNILYLEGLGCAKCRHTGYKGRLGIYELLLIDDEMRDLISRSPSVMDLRRMAVQKGMRDLRADGMAKVGQGLTTVEEILRVTES